MNDDPRFLLQQRKRIYGIRPVVADRDWDRSHDRDNDAWGRDGHHRHDGGGNPPAGAGNGIVKDWNTPLGSGSSSSGAITVASGYCIGPSEGVAINGVNITTNATGAHDTVTINADPGNGQTVTIPGGGTVYHLQSTCGAQTYCVVDGGTGTAGHTATAENLAAAVNNNSAQCGTTAPCFANVTAANTSVSASNPGSNVTTLTNLCAGAASSYTAPTSSSGNVAITAITAGGNGSAGTGTFALPNPVNNGTVASNMATAIGTETATDLVTATATSNVVNLKSSGTSSNVTLALASTPTGLTLSGANLTGGTTATVQPNAYPAKWGPSLTTASCALDYVAYPTGQAGATGAANIIAYNNIYTAGCTGTVPQTYWAFNTGAGYSVTTSPIVSLDGSKIAFVQSNGTQAQLVVVKWATGGTLIAPTAPTLVTNITTCTAPCMTVTTFSGSHDDTYSSPYYDYSGVDDVYVGDDSGYLQKFTGLFSGTSVSVTSTTLGAFPLTSPVYDSVSGCVFVGDSDGYLYSANSGNTGTVCSIGFSLRGRSFILSDGNPNSGIFDAPIVDSTAQTVYAFVTSSAVLPTTVQGTIEFNFGTFTYNTINGSGGTSGSFTAADVGKTITGADINAGTTISAVSTTGNTTATLSTGATCGTFPACGPLTFTVDLAAVGSNVVDEFLTSTITQGTSTIGPEATQTIGTGGDGYDLYSGTFDNVYYSSANATGNLYAIGNTGVTTGATLFRIPVASSVMSTPVSAVTGLTPNAANAYPWPSPLTEFCNNGTSACTASTSQTTAGTDYLFFSVNRGNVTGCTNTVGNGCTLSYAITTTSPLLSGSGLNKVAAGTTGCWATSGIVLDNSAALTVGAMQIYFVDMNGAAAGGPNGATSANCNATSAPTINAVQTSQSNP